MGKKVYTLEVPETELDKVAGMKATVKGKFSGETVTVDSVECASPRALPFAMLTQLRCALTI